MKKALTFLLLAALLATPLVGCHKGDSDEPAKTTTDNKADDIPEYNAADANPASDFEYKVGEDGVTITKYIGTDTNVVIPEKIDGKNVTAIGESAFSSNKTLISVAMPDTVTLIDAVSFYNCDLLTAVRLSQSLERIRNEAFLNCDKLSKIELPDSLYLIGTRAFAYCPSLKEITIPAKCFQIINGIGYYEANAAFYKSGLETLIISEGVQVLTPYVFANTNIKEVVIPSSVQHIEQEAFDDCTKLEKITLNEGIQSIGASAFANTKITEITIPKTVETISETVFNGASQLKKVQFEGNAPESYASGYTESTADYTVYFHPEATGFTAPVWFGYSSVMIGSEIELSENANFTYFQNDNGSITISEYIGSDTHVVIPETIDGVSVTRIGAFALFKNETVTSVTIPDSVTAIGDYAFSDCTHLAEVKFPQSSLAELGNSAFYRCQALKHIEVPASLEVFGERAFCYSGLETVVLAEGLKEIGTAAFQLTVLKEITIPDSVTKIGDAAFSSCYRLTSVKLGNGVTSIGADAFYGDALEELVIPESMKIISSSALAYCDELTAIYFEGNAPEGFNLADLTDDIYQKYTPTFTVYYHEGAEGFTSPEWNGYTTEIW